MDSTRNDLYSKDDDDYLNVSLNSSHDRLASVFSSNSLIGEPVFKDSNVGTSLFDSTRDRHIVDGMTSGPYPWDSLSTTSYKFQSPSTPAEDPFFRNTVETFSTSKPDFGFLSIGHPNLVISSQRDPVIRGDSVYETPVELGRSSQLPSQNKRPLRSAGSRLAGSPLRHKGTLFYCSYQGCARSAEGNGPPFKRNDNRNIHERNVHGKAKHSEMEDDKEDESTPLLLGAPPPAFSATSSTITWSNVPLGQQAPAISPGNSGSSSNSPSGSTSAGSGPSGSGSPNTSASGGSNQGGLKPAPNGGAGQSPALLQGGSNTNNSNSNQGGPGPSPSGIFSPNSFLRSSPFIMLVCLLLFSLSIWFQGLSIQTYYSSSPQAFDGAWGDADYKSLVASFANQTLELFISLLTLPGIKDLHLASCVIGVGCASFASSVLGLVVYFYHTTLGDTMMHAGSVLQNIIWLIVAFDLRERIGTQIIPLDYLRGGSP